VHYGYKWGLRSAGLPVRRPHHAFVGSPTAALLAHQREVLVRRRCALSCATRARAVARWLFAATRIEAEEHSALDGGRCVQRDVPDGSASAGLVLSADRPVAERGRPAADHPWRKAWSIRRQREIALTA